MKRLTLTLTILLCLTTWGQVHANASASIRATLVLASDEGSSIDSSLRPYQRQLRRFGSSFKKLGDGSTYAAAGDKKTIRLSGNNQVAISVISIEKKTVRGREKNDISLEAVWKEGRKTVYRIRGSLPLALAAPPDSNGTRVLIIDES
jgi:hypothetical protein